MHRGVHGRPSVHYTGRQYAATTRLRVNVTGPQGNIPSLPVETKDLVSIKKALQGDGDWTKTKEILGWMVDTDDGTLRLSPKRKAELGTLLDIPPSQRWISTKKIERLIGKLRSMHLAVPGAVGHLYNLQQSLTAAHHTHRATAYVTRGFNSDPRFWRRICAEMPTRPTYLAEIVQRLPTDIGFADASGLGAGGGLDRPKRRWSELRVALTLVKGY